MSRTARPLALGELRYLPAAMALLQEREGMRNCVQRSVALALDLPHAAIVFGTLPAATPEQLAARPDSSREPFIHCWCEIGGYVLAPTTIEQLGELRPIPRAVYYHLNGVSDPRPVPREEFARIAREWGLRSALKHHPARFGNGKVAEALLAAARVRYRLGAGNALLPIGSAA